MTQFIPDTNTFLRLLLKDVPSQYEEAKKLFTCAKEGKVKLLVPQIVVFEIVFSLEKYYKFSKAEVIDKLQAILSAPYFEIQDQDIFRSSLELYKLRNISFVDCFLIAEAQSLEAKIFTFDQNLNKVLKGF